MARDAFISNAAKIPISELTSWSKRVSFCFVLFCFCVQFPGSLAPLKLAEPYKGIENETSFILTELATKHMFDVSLHVFTTISNFWSSNVVNLVSRKDEGIKPIVFGAFSCRESALKSCTRCDK